MGYLDDVTMLEGQTATLRHFQALGSFKDIQAGRLFK